MSLLFFITIELATLASLIAALWELYNGHGWVCSEMVWELACIDVFLVTGIIEVLRKKDGKNAKI